MDFDFELCRQIQARLECMDARMDRMISTYTRIESRLDSVIVTIDRSIDRASEIRSGAKKQAAMVRVADPEEQADLDLAAKKNGEHVTVDSPRVPHILPLGKYIEHLVCNQTWKMPIVVESNRTRRSLPRTLAKERYHKVRKRRKRRESTADTSTHVLEASARSSRMLLVARRDGLKPRLGHSLYAARSSPQRIKRRVVKKGKNLHISLIGFNDQTQNLFGGKSYNGLMMMEKTHEGARGDMEWTTSDQVWEKEGDYAKGIGDGLLEETRFMSHGNQRAIEEIHSFNKRDLNVEFEGPVVAGLETKLRGQKNVNDAAKFEFKDWFGEHDRWRYQEWQQNGSNMRIINHESKPHQVERDKGVYPAASVTRDGGKSLAGKDPRGDQRFIEPKPQRCSTGRDIWDQKRFTKDTNKWEHELADIGAKSTVVMAGLLHDTLDDSFMSYDYIRRNFGAGVADWVEGVSKLSQLSKLDRENNTACKTVEADRLHTMFLAMADARAVLINMADMEMVHENPYAEYEWWRYKMRNYNDRKHLKAAHWMEGDELFDEHELLFDENDRWKYQKENDDGCRMRNDFWVIKSGDNKADMINVLSMNFEKLLYSEMNLYGDGVLPPKDGYRHVEAIVGPCVLHVDAIVDVGWPSRRCLQLSMTDGVYHFTGRECRPIGNVQVLGPAGLKMGEIHSPVRHGFLILAPESAVVLGAPVVWFGGQALMQDHNENDESTLMDKILSEDFEVRDVWCQELIATAARIRVPQIVRVALERNRTIHAFHYSQLDYKVCILAGYHLEDKINLLGRSNGFNGRENSCETKKTLDKPWSFVKDGILRSLEQFDFHVLIEIIETVAQGLNEKLERKGMIANIWSAMMEEKTRIFGKGRDMNQVLNYSDKLLLDFISKGSFTSWAKHEYRRYIEHRTAALINEAWMVMNYGRSGVTSLLDSMGTNGNEFLVAVKTSLLSQDCVESEEANIILQYQEKEIGVTQIKLVQVCKALNWGVVVHFPVFRNEQLVLGQDLEIKEALVSITKRQEKLQKGVKSLLGFLDSELQELGAKTKTSSIIKSGFEFQPP